MYSPIRSIDSVKYWSTDTTPVETTLDTDFYHALPETGRLMRLKSFPSSSSQRQDAVKIRMSVGFTDAASVPPDIKAAILLQVGTRYRYREDLDGRRFLNIVDGGAHAIAQRRKVVWQAVNVR
jgi:hypothetical protein